MARRLSIRTGSAWTVTPAPDAGYAELPPWPALSAYVERVYVGREVLAAPTEEHVVPDGSVGLVWNLGDAPRVEGREDGGGVGVVAGAAIAPVTLRMAGRVDQVGVRLRPGAVGALLGVRADEVAGRTVALEALWGAAASELGARLAEAAPADRLGILERALTERVARCGRAPRDAVAVAVRRVEAARGRIRVRALAEAVGLGERRLEQAFREELGLTPKQVCRLARLRAGLAGLADPRRPLADVAFAAGFSDQAHLGNEVRRIAGLTPRELRRRLSDFSKTRH